MSQLDRYFEEYARFHRDARNEATHALGIPMIVLAVVMWAANVRIAQLGPVTVDLAWILIVAVSAFYVALNLPLGMLMAAILVALHIAGVSLLGANGWIALGLFAGGWVLQFVGHHFEGKRPAFLRNGIHLLVGPLWLVQRALGRIGLRLARD